MGASHACHHPGCLKKFDRKYNLKCHLRIHSNEKPYQCYHPQCTRSFRWKSSLNHHLMSLDHTTPAIRRARKAHAQSRRLARAAAASATAAAAAAAVAAASATASSPTSASVTPPPNLSPTSDRIPNSSIPPAHPLHLTPALSPVSSRTIPSASAPASASGSASGSASASASYAASPPPMREATPLRLDMRPNPEHLAPPSAANFPVVPHLQHPLSLPSRSLSLPMHLPVSVPVSVPVSIPLAEHPSVAAAAAAASAAAAAAADALDAATAKPELRFFVEESSPSFPLSVANIPRCTSEADTSVHTSVDEALSMVIPIKPDDSFAHSSPKAYATADRDALFESSGHRIQTDPTHYKYHHAQLQSLQKQQLLQQQQQQQHPSLHLQHDDNHIRNQNPNLQHAQHHSMQHQMQNQMPYHVQPSVLPQQQVQQQTSNRLVSVESFFEEISPVSLMAYSSTLDNLLQPHADGQA